MYRLGDVQYFFFLISYVKVKEEREREREREREKERETRAHTHTHTHTHTPNPLVARMTHIYRQTHEVSNDSIIKKPTKLHGFWQKA